MPTTGWYPDPDGTKGRFRYWDGDAWSEATTTDPQQTPPPRKASSGEDKKGRGRESGWVIALVILAVLTAIAVIILLTSTNSGFFSGGGVATEDNNSSTPTVSAWDETSTPTITPPPLPTDDGGIWVNCPTSSGDGRTNQPLGKLAAGKLTVQIPSGYSSEWMAGMTLAYDAHGVKRDIPGGVSYVSSIGVGLTSFDDGFDNLIVTAAQAMQCWSQTYHPLEADPIILISGEETTISGHAAWHIRWELVYIHEPIPGEVLDIITVDMGPGTDYLGLYWSCRPVNNTDFEQSITSAIASLKVG